MGCDGYCEHGEPFNYNEARQCYEYNCHQCCVDARKATMVKNSFTLPGHEEPLAWVQGNDIVINNAFMKRDADGLKVQLTVEQAEAFGKWLLATGNKLKQ